MNGYKLYFYIGKWSGNHQTQKSLTYICKNNLAAAIGIWSPFHPKAGPFAVQHDNVIKKKSTQNDNSEILTSIYACL